MAHLPSAHQSDNRGRWPPGPPGRRRRLGDATPGQGEPPVKYTLLITQACNLACEYCYVGKRAGSMPLPTLRKAIDFAFEHTPREERIDVGFFGGEPLLEFDLIKAGTDLIERHPLYDADRVELAIVTNGTIFSDEIVSYVREHGVGFVVSCDGPPDVHDAFRRFPDGRGTSHLVERTIERALDAFSLIPVNAVYHPTTLRHLPRTVEYLSSLGVRQIYLNPDFSAGWTEDDAASLPEVFGRIADLYTDYYLRGDPHFISSIDNRIAVILRGGYEPLERCRMGRGEFAFAPDGRVYPCERLVGADANDHCIGNLKDGLEFSSLSCHLVPGSDTNAECRTCGVSAYCINWCGCSNYFSSGYYNRVGGFLCASERAILGAALNAYERLEAAIGPGFFEHAGGFPIVNSSRVRERRRTESEADGVPLELRVG
jgi:uncharacterized protein